MLSLQPQLRTDRGRVQQPMREPALRQAEVKNGGNGFCVGCEVLLKTEAAVAGSEPPPPNKRWEDVVLDDLIPRVVDEHGMKRPYESRDDHRHMLGSNKRTRSGECDTAHQRRPDLLYVVREPVDSRIVAFLSVEVDEDSHCDRDPNCEGGKIDETFQALTKLAQTEGCSRGAAARHDASGSIWPLSQVQSERL